MGRFIPVIIIKHKVFTALLPTLLSSTGSNLDPDFVYVNTAMTWSDAQMYCRENFLDLATIKNDVENQQVQSLTNELTWIGLYREPNLLWSDGSSVLFRNIDSINMMIGSKTIICGAAATGRSGRWKGLPCETRLPFVCYGLPGECFFLIKRRK
uniref:C-type lectin domain-containing protein n=1 Tax=Cyprinodon variegatus TaxID=28743 RepID=A0A3Q2CT41_CYPVA